MKIGKFAKMALLAACISGLGSVAKAETINATLLGVGTPVSTVTGNLAPFNYQAVLSATGAVIASNDFFSISPVAGFAGFDTAGSTTATFIGYGGSTWSAVATPVGPLTGLTFTYTGAAVIKGPHPDTNAGGDPTPLVKVSFFDTFAGAAGDIATFTSQDHKLNLDGTIGGLETLHVATIDAPDPTSGAATPLPLAVVAGMGLFGAIAAKRKLQPC